MIKICKYCGKEFNTDNERQLYCSVDCRDKSSVKRHTELVQSKAVQNPIQGKSLYQWCISGGEYGNTLIKEFSDKNKVSMRSLAAGTRQKVIWKCSKCGYEWNAVVLSRTRSRSGCPSCAGKVIENNNLYTWCLANGERGQRLLKEYSDKNVKHITKIAPGSHFKAIWHCSVCGYEWKAVVRNRINNRDCPSCAGKIIETNNLLDWCLHNGARGAKILREYSDKNDITPDKIAHANGSKKVWWKCSNCGHEWKTVVSSRVTANTDCPKCNRAATSYGEQCIYYVLNRELKNYTVLNRSKINGFEIDILVPELKFGIEYSGSLYHKDKVDKDKRKYEALTKAGYNIIVIVEYYRNEDYSQIRCDFAYERKRILNPEVALEFVKDYLKNRYNLDIEIHMSNDEKELCKNKAVKLVFDFDEILVLKALGKSTYGIGDILGCSGSLIADKLYKDKDRDEVCQKISDIQGIISSLRLGYSPEEIASNSVEADTSIFEFDIDDKTYDLDFVLKIKSLLEKYEAI